MITPLNSVTNCAVEERDGRLHVAGVRINISAEREAWRAMDDARSGVRLDDNRLDRIDDALSAKALIRGSNRPVGLDPSARLHRCVGCGAPFIAHPAARLCSAECRIAFQRASQRKASAKRSIKRDERRAALRVRCRQCGEPVESASRRQRAFCSNACRQAAYRARADLRRPSRMGRV
jgi:predicted nucleic acid-binding Zn ribbon protein